jgi:hydrogenase small subunit
MVDLVWLQGATDNGCTISFLNTQQPDVAQIINKFGVKIVFHPTINPTSGKEAIEALRPYIEKKDFLDVLILEGAISQGPNDTGQYCIVGDRPLKDILLELSAVANCTVAIGTCASFGGMAASDPNPTQATGLQFYRSEKGGFLGKDYKSRMGLPVVNLPGCPPNSDWIAQTLAALLLGKGDQLELDEYQRPLLFYSGLSHHGCPRNEYFEYKQGAEMFTEEGCLFDELGCKGPLTHSDCNTRLWNRQSSKTRSGSPCIGCTEPDFPEGSIPFFETPKTRAGIPKKLPLGVQRTRYIAWAGTAKVACPSRLKKIKSKKQ